ncbi:MAG TPA: SpoIIE family protein phosphatase [Bacteroidales bacterium]|nr:SpoIIE family protein phosphatase [Bacteroidales bacterium]
MALRKTTIFRQLIFNVAIPTLLALLVFAGINFQRTRSILASGTDEKNKLLSNEVTKILRFQDIAFNLIDGEINTRLRDFSLTLINKYFSNTDNMKNLDLRAIANEIGMDPVNEDIYVVSADGIIINTTFKQDLNLDLFSLGEKMKIYLLGVIEKGEFVADLFAVEHRTHKARKYSYQPTNDGKYIIEIGAYSKQVDDVIMAIEDTKAELKKETEGIIDVELFLMADFPFSMNKNFLELPSQKDTLLRCFLDKDTISFMERVGEKWNHYQYIYMERSTSKDQPNSGLYKGSVIRIISDRTEQQALFRVEAKRFMLVFIITMLVLTIVIYRKTKVITLPIKKLVENVDRITNGNLRERAEVTGNNEITKLSEKFNMMIAQLESYYYELEEKVKERTLRIEHQKEEIEEQKKHIMDSIYYARRIQNAILPSFSLINTYLENYFILYLPKDIVSGDFYWMHEVDGLFMLAAVDCTGHGVPGAFMSIVGFNQLNHAVNVKKARTASNILDALNRGVITTLNENSSDNSIKDGMDMTLCVFDFIAKKVEFSGANNPLILIRDNMVRKYKGDRFPIGAFEGRRQQRFKNNEIDLLEGDCLYLSSDGYADQFGGTDNKKFMYRRFEELLLEIHSQPMEVQKKLLQERLNEWMGTNDQVDDILVIGIRV